MTLHSLAGKPAPKDTLIDTDHLIADYYEKQPDPEDFQQRVSFGTSGHRGSSFTASFNENHILATSQAICEYRKAQKIQGPMFLGMDTHALSQPAFETALEVFAANDILLIIQQNHGFTPTPVISKAILDHNRQSNLQLADGVVITPSHNPPQDGGFKYNPPEGGPAPDKVTSVIQNRANEILINNLAGVRRIPMQRALARNSTYQSDLISPYVNDLDQIIDMQAIKRAGLAIGVDPMGGSSLEFWEPIAKTFGLDIDVVNPTVDPKFGFMPLDKDGKIRMDCSSPYAMAGLIRLKNSYDIAFGNDPDADRHGIVTPSGGLMNPNHFLAVSIMYLFSHRPLWRKSAEVGKTLVSSSMIDRVVASLQRPLMEVPVGFKWFVYGLLNDICAFAGEESAGASFSRKDQSVWTTDKDGIVMNLLAAEMTAVTGKDPHGLYHDLETQFGSPIYRRMDAPASLQQKKVLKNLSPEMIVASYLAGEPIESVLTRAPANNALFGGLKVITKNGWFAARPSGTEAIYKIYAESFVDEAHLEQIQNEAQKLVNDAFHAAGVD